ncbi:Fe3+ hydroxamate ABC transporter substrate-binding protein [Bacillus toyonensis]|uniref:Fe3+ hydroxamate ABC transporter substrate-binding protein n=1 Tax=Bacillus toyonensis TaxID=155322 RepID=UPI000BEFCEA8|nr:Fe3+ hydroxamate ABC transporter substrate-binding protein [Bacillus toyonensis]MCU4967851.1 Fe3+ hydroxamate ABC transporter substrate-binding protein [Bacillus toyonensis]PEJ83380.1 Fe3+ hydroxamate ABC transporter substrate-binding protein [Bacillus toyonensis]PEK08256.1 Fe3+ hydroxamate ABC transporter substrate-binding protein [Bacillus toyonensis]PGC84327.1 Fe3+ hydroxamate ABC transporter substrate-binding protein [Bacillus toyonensis]PGE76252.1 Fe3+ hydroxamate ABC transporter subst
MLIIKPKCVSCKKNIQGGERVYVELHYPHYAGMTEIKKWLDSEGKIYCLECHSKQ